MSNRPVQKSVAAALVILAAAAGAASAQASKVGLVDTRRLITGSAAGKQILAKLDQLADQKAEQRA